MTGEVVNTIPPRGVRASKEAQKWDEFAVQARREYPAAVKAADRIKHSTLTGIRQRTRAPYRTDDGRIQVIARDSFTEDGIAYSSMYFLWVPTGTPKRKRTRA